jgi:AcrR family transcriptional regulator
MEIKPRTQAERTATTRVALVGAARRLFAARGYAAVGTPEIAQAAGVSRGALYHQFSDKSALFAAVVEQVEAEVTEQLVAAVSASGEQDPVATLRLAVSVWLDLARSPEVRRLVLSEAPVVLGWVEWRDLVARYGLGLTEALLADAMSTGALTQQPVRPLAAILVGALNEAALLVAHADDHESARAEATWVLEQMIGGLVGSPPLDN